MDYDNWDESYIVAGSLSSQFNQSKAIPEETQAVANDSSYTGYNYKEMINNAYRQYNALGSLMVKKDAAITFTAIGAIGLALICLNSLIIKLGFLAIATILSFDVEIQIPCASILLVIFVFRGNMTIAKAALLILSFVVLIYAYWEDSLVSYQDLIWWLNIAIVILWAWLIFMSSNWSYSQVIEFGGAVPESLHSTYNSFDDDEYSTEE